MTEILSHFAEFNQKAFIKLILQIQNAKIKKMKIINQTLNL